MQTRNVVLRFSVAIRAALLLLVTTVISANPDGLSAATLVVDFEDLSLAANSHNERSLGFTSRGAMFNNTFTDFGSFSVWGGWAYSNEGDVTTPGFGNQFSSFSGGGDNSSNFGVGYVFPGGTPAYIDLPTGHALQSVRVTNITYAALSMRDGDSFAKKFGGADGNDPDFFKLTVTGHTGSHTGSILGSVDFFLADFRFSDNTQDYIVDEWTTVDLSSLSGSNSLTFSLESTDNDSMNGMNTPAYFAVDNLILSSIEEVPEPGSLALLLVGSGMLAYGAVRRRQQRATRPEASRT